MKRTFRQTYGQRVEAYRHAARHPVILIIIMILAALNPCNAGADIFSISGGLGTVLDEERDTDESRELAVLIIDTSYKSRTWDFILDLQLRWYINDKTFLSEEWNRKGDWLRPIKAAAYSNTSGKWSVGLFAIMGRTIGSGRLVRGLSGAGEVDYEIPGLMYSWNGESIQIDGLLDRIIDPTVAAVAVKWEPGDSFRLILEGAADPSAPLTFTGNFKNGRPVADIEDPVSAIAVELSSILNNGRVFDMRVSLHGGKLVSEATSFGAGLELNWEFSPYYTNSLLVKVDYYKCSGGYLPVYFDELYPINRWGLTGTTMRNTYQLGPGEVDRKMESFSLAYNLGRYFKVAGGADRFSDNSMKRAHFKLSVLEEGGRGVEAMIWSRADDVNEELFDTDTNLFSKVSALYNFLPHLRVRFDLKHSWAFKEARGGLIPTSSFLFGALYSISM